MRKGTVERNTKETKISCSLNLDGVGSAKISTGIGFFDHMLELFVHHSLIDMDLKTDGDTNVDGIGINMSNMGSPYKRNNTPRKKIANSSGKKKGKKGDRYTEVV